MATCPKSKESGLGPVVKASVGASPAVTINGIVSREV
jgi:hypothetical protein